eukprot:6182821-Pleurochrysis_carterae.AAC.3
MKEFDEMCCAAHCSPGVARGGSFTRFVCPCCGYKPASERVWRRDLDSFHALSDAEQKAARSAHNELLFAHPLPKLEMAFTGVDMLHLVYLNLFKHLFRYTVHDGLPGTKKRLVRDYLRNAGFYSYDAASAQEEDPVKRWIGREVKRFLQQAHLHLPFLLRLAAAPPDMCPDMQQLFNEEGEIGMDIDEEDEYAPSAEELHEEEQEEPLMMTNADRWDRFLEFVKEIQRPWTTEE